MKDSGIDFYNSFFGKYLLSVGNSTLIVLLTTRVGCRVSSYERRRAAGQPSMKQEPDDIPVICRLSDAELRAREATLLAQFRRAVIATQELPDGYSFRLPGDKKSLAGVAELIAAERDCCPFLTFELAAHPNMGPVDVRVTGPSGTKDFLRTVFCEPEAAI